MARRNEARYAPLAELNQAKSELARLEAGAWQYDIAIAEAAVASADAEVQQIKTERQRLVVQASVDGEVLQVNVRPGEFITTFGQQSAIVLGNTKDLHVRVDIDEYDLPRFQPGARAIARRRGHAEDHFPLTFVRVDPFVIPMRALTGENSERGEARVLQVIYEIDTQAQQPYVGQQLDEFIDANSSGTSLANPISLHGNRATSRSATTTQMQHH